MNDWWELWTFFGTWQFSGWLYLSGQQLAPDNPQAVAENVTQGLANKMLVPVFTRSATGIELLSQPQSSP